MRFTEPDPAPQTDRQTDRQTDQHPAPDKPAIAKRPGAAFAWLRMTTVAGVLSGCSSPVPVNQPRLPERPVQPAQPVQPGQPGQPVQPASRETAEVRPAPPPQAPVPPRTWDEYRLQAAQRLIAANPGKTYLGEVPQTLLAIPVLEIDVNADGSVRRIQVLRYPRQAKDTTQLAIDAVHRAAPFGNVARLPRPWKFVETFLFNDARLFKPRSLD